MSENIYFILMLVTMCEMIVLSFFGFINLKLKKIKHSRWTLSASNTMTCVFMAVAILSYAVTAPIIVVMSMGNDCWIIDYPIIARIIYTIIYLTIAVAMHSVACLLGYLVGMVLKKAFLKRKQEQLNHRRKELLSRSYEMRRREQEEYFSALQTINAWAEMSEA